MNALRGSTTQRMSLIMKQKEKIEYIIAPIVMNVSLKIAMSKTI